MREIFHEQSLQTQFMRSGYVRVPMLAPEDTANILQELATLKPDDNFAPQGHGGFDHKFHCSFLDRNVEYKRRAFDLIKSSFEAHIARYLNGYRILSCNFYVKPPGTGTFVIHQNWPTIPNINDTTVTVWCPLQDVVETNGAIQFVPGSHKILPYVEGPACPGYFNNFRQTLIDKYLKPNEMSSGEAMIFDDGLIHWSANNDSDKPRIAIQIACVPADCTPTFHFFDSRHPERFELIEADTDFYLDSDIVDLTRRQPHWKSLGFVENRNRFIDEAEFVALLEQGPALREKIYAEIYNPLKPVTADLESDQASHADTREARATPSESGTEKVTAGPTGFWSHIRSSLPKFFSANASR